jgi:GAF domain-containing protein/DNA-binding CsgD family transcriptional regulator
LSLTLDPAGDQVLADITEMLAHTRLDIVTILTTLTASLSRRRRGTWFAILMNKDPSTSRFMVADDSNPALAEYFRRYVTTLERPEILPTAGMSRKVIDTGRAVLLPKVTAEHFLTNITQTGMAFYSQNRPPTETEFFGLMLVPMHAGEATIGTLGVIDWGAVQQLSEEDVDWVQAVADRAGLALEHAVMQGAAIYRLERLAALRSIALAITSSDDLRLTLEVILEQSTTKLAVDAAGVLLVDESTHELFAGAVTGFHSTSIPNYRIPIDVDLRDAAILRREPMLTDLDRVDHGQRRSLFAREGFQFYLGKPLVARNKLVGLLEVFHRTELAPDQEWIGFLETIATTAAIAVDQTAMREQLARSKPAPPPHLAPAPELSRLERWILGLVIDGATNQEVAEKVHLSQNTVKFHVRRILQKAGAANRTELARIATQQAWL